MRKSEKYLFYILFIYIINWNTIKLKFDELRTKEISKLIPSKSPIGGCFNGTFVPSVMQYSVVAAVLFIF